jgi:alpha-1,3-rhamnosyl/mannosyltransferase
MHRRLDVDLYHSPYYLMPYRPTIPTVVTLHDLIPLRYPQYFSLVQRLIFAATVRLATRAAQQVVAVSHATADDLQDLLGLGASRIRVIPEAADPAFHPRSARQIETVRRRQGLPERYALYLGSNKPHKNLSRLVEAWAKISDMQRATAPGLVIAGVWDDRYPEPRQRAAALGVEESIIWLGPIPEADLPALYTGATAFIFPSVYEGFGLPVLEAMACGTPVGCSNTSSLPEVAGDAALLFDPTTADSIAQALHRMLADDRLRRDLSERGLSRAGELSWERTAKETLKLYRELAL